MNWEIQSLVTVVPKVSPLKLEPFLSVLAFYYKGRSLWIDILTRIHELLRESYRLMLHPQMGLKVTICLEWPTFATLMITMRWLWYCDSIIPWSFSRRLVRAFFVLNTRSQPSTVNLKLSIVTACVVVKCAPRSANHFPHIRHLYGSSWVLKSLTKCGKHFLRDSGMIIV